MTIFFYKGVFWHYTETHVEFYSNYGGDPLLVPFDLFYQCLITPVDRTIDLPETQCIIDTNSIAGFLSIIDKNQPFEFEISIKIIGETLNFHKFGIQLCLIGYYKDCRWCFEGENIRISYPYFRLLCPFTELMDSGSKYSRLVGTRYHSRKNSKYIYISQEPNSEITYRIEIEHLKATYKEYCKWNKTQNESDTHEAPEIESNYEQLTIRQMIDHSLTVYKTLKDVDEICKATTHILGLLDKIN